MLPGPVFNFELMATARRNRFYLIRAFYAAILFVILWGVHSAWTSETGGELASRWCRGLPSRRFVRSRSVRRSLCWC